MVDGIGNTVNINSFGFTDINGIPSKPTNITITSECGGSWFGNIDLQDEEVYRYFIKLLQIFKTKYFKFYSFNLKIFKNINI